jgi:hypothetical protein
VCNINISLLKKERKARPTVNVEFES